MPLYLDEIYLNATPPDNAKKVIALLQEALKGGLPQGVTLKAGPWASNEEPKVILVLDIQDHSLTFNTFAKIVAQGLVAKRRLTPIVEWSGKTGERDLSSCSSSRNIPSYEGAAAHPRSLFHYRTAGVR